MRRAAPLVAGLAGVIWLAACQSAVPEGKGEPSALPAPATGTASSPQATASPTSPASSSLPSAPAVSQSPSYIGNDAIFDLLAAVTKDAPKQFHFGKDPTPEEDPGTISMLSPSEVAPDRCAALATVAYRDGLANTVGYEVVAAAANNDTAFLATGARTPTNAMSNLLDVIDRCGKFTVSFPSPSELNFRPTRDVLRYRVNVVGVPTEQRIDLSLSVQGNVQSIDPNSRCLFDPNADGPGDCMYDVTIRSLESVLRDGDNYIYLHGGSFYDYTGQAKLPWPPSSFFDYAGEVQSALAAATGKAN